MSYAWLFGFLIGMVAVVGVGIVGMRDKRQTESDERTEAIKLQAGSTSFVLTAGFAGLAWVYEIVKGYLAGTEAPVVTPWSILLAAMLFIYLGALLYQKWRLSVWSDLDEQERSQLRRRAGTLVVGMGALGASARMAFEQGAGTVGWFLTALALLGLAGGLTLAYMTKNRVERH